jgi:hypothetical protein
MSGHNKNVRSVIQSGHSPVGLSPECPLDPRLFAPRFRQSVGTLVTHGKAGVCARISIKKFVPVINYERAGYEFKTVIICTAPVSDRHELVEETKELNEVTFVRELMTGRRNVHVTVVASDKETITDVGNRLSDIGLTVESKEQILRDCVQPFGEF